MKKVLFLPMLLLMSLVLAPDARGQFTAGAYGMLNLASISGDAPDDFSYGGNSGFGFGVIGEFHLTDDVWLSVQPGIQPRGAGIEVKDQEDPVKISDLNLSYVAIPILAKFVTAKGKVYVTSGVNVAFLTSANLKAVEGDEEVDVKDAIKGVDFAVDFGVGGQLPVGSLKIMLEARYEQGLSNVLKDEISEDALRTRLRSAGLQLFAGILLPLGGGE